MKNTLLIFVGYLILSSCQGSKQPSSQIDLELQRIDKSLSSAIEYKRQSLTQDILLNPEKWGPTNFKILPFLDLTDSIFADLHSESIKKDVAIELVSQFIQGVSKLALYDEYLEQRRNQRLDYWISETPRNVNEYALAIDLHLCIIDIMDELRDAVIKSSVSVNVLNPIILESSDVVGVGETYVARIGLQAYDSTDVPRVLIDGIDLETQDGFGVFRATSNIPGVKTFEGEILIMHNRHVISRTFEESYIVK